MEFNESSELAGEAMALASWNVIVERALVAQFDTERKLIWCNDNFNRAFGKAGKPAQGRMLADLLRIRQNQDLFDDELWKRIETENIPVSRVAAHDADGSPIWLRATFTRVLDADGKLASVLLMANDVSQEIITSAETEARLGAITRSQLVLELELDGTIIEANAKLCEALGKRRSDIVGTLLHELGSPTAPGQPDWPAIFETVRSGEAASALFSLQTRTDQSLNIRSRLFPLLDPDGTPVRCLMLAIDITNEQRLENELEKAESAAKSKSSFLAHMSHEVRTPMAGVMGYAELLRSCQLDPQAHRYASLIHESGEKMMQLLNDILDVSKIEAGQMHIASQDVKLRPKIETCADLMMPIAEQKGVTLAWRCADDLPEFIVSDRLRLRQILLNLIGNAVKFTNAGTVTVIARRDPDDPEILLIEVCDTGIGIPADRLKSVLSKFVQADSGISDSFGGSGLGLTITNELAQLMGGSLQIESTPGIGTTACVRLPLEASARSGSAEAVAETNAKESIAQPASASRAGLRVLVAEDNDINQALVLEQLNRIGVAADIAPDGKKAVDMVIRAQDSRAPYDLVFMDLRMPEMDGLEAARTIRNRGFRPHMLPIVALTANAYEEDVQACLTAGMQSHLAKPTSTQALAEEIDKRLATRGRRNAPSEPAREAESAPGEPVPLVERYRARRDEALAFLVEVALSGSGDPAQLQTLANMLHKLAGTAGMFGEEPLGNAARALEAVIRNSSAQAAAKAIREREGELLALVSNGVRDAA